MKNIKLVICAALLLPAISYAQAPLASKNQDVRIVKSTLASCEAIFEYGLSQEGKALNLIYDKNIEDVKYFSTVIRAASAQDKDFQLSVQKNYDQLTSSIEAAKENGYWIWIVQLRKNIQSCATTYLGK